MTEITSRLCPRCAHDVPRGCDDCDGRGEIVRVVDDQFPEDLEAVFGERCKDLSKPLLAMLKTLWREGVKHGRHVERELSHPPVRAERPWAHVKTELSMEDIIKAAKEFDDTERLAPPDHRQYLASRPISR
jgi:hypothetical protein